MTSDLESLHHQSAQQSSRSLTNRLPALPLFDLGSPLSDACTRLALSKVVLPGGLHGVRTICAVPGVANYLEVLASDRKVVSGYDNHPIGRYNIAPSTHVSPITQIGTD